MGTKQLYRKVLTGQNLHPQDKITQKIADTSTGALTLSGRKTAISVFKRLHKMLNIYR
jgi:hypothetical protein